MNDNVYGAVLMTMVTARVHPVHLQTERRVAANPQTKPTDLSCESADKRLLPSTSTIAICYYYSARKLILILPSTEGGRLSRPQSDRTGNPEYTTASRRPKEACDCRMRPQAAFVSSQLERLKGLLRPFTANKLFDRVITREA